MKRRIAFLLIVMLVLGMFGGCKSNEEDFAINGSYAENEQMVWGDENDDDIAENDEQENKEPAQDEAGEQSQQKPTKPEAPDPEPEKEHEKEEDEPKKEPEIEQEEEPEPEEEEEELPVGEGGGPLFEESENPYKNSLKILAFGNSFSKDAMRHLWDIAKSYGVKNVVLGNLNIGGCSLETHYTNMTQNAAVYTYSKNTAGTWENTKNVAASTGLQDEDWDIITIQHHCMWGIGAASGPYIMGWILSGGSHWSGGYRAICLIQVVLTAVLFVSLPLWKGRQDVSPEGEPDGKPLSLGEILRIPGAKEILVTFFCYCAVEQTTALWASSYLALYKGVPTETAAYFASMFFLGITLGRGLNGFLTIRFTDTQLIRMGNAIIALGIGAMLLPLGTGVSIAGLILIGLGCAPIYPCVIHSTPEHFGPERSQALIGVQMASAYCGTLLMPPLFGLMAEYASVELLPVYLLGILALMALMFERMLRKASGVPPVSPRA